MEQIEAGTEPDEYVRSQDEGLVKANVEAGIVDEPEDVTLSHGLVGQLDERMVVSADGLRVRQMQLVALKSAFPTAVLGAAN